MNDGLTNSSSYQQKKPGAFLDPTVHDGVKDVGGIHQQRPGLA
jgi:hypothetical protein